MENGVTWWVMSVRRTSGAMLKMTARQMATASFAVPKSVMKTIVGREAEAGCAVASSFCAGCEQAAQHRIRTSRPAAVRRVREIIESPPKCPSRLSEPGKCNSEEHEYT